MKIKEQEHSLDSKDQLAKRLEVRSAGMVAENAELSANLVEVRQRLESEVRIRESRAAKQVKKMLLDAMRDISDKYVHIYFQVIDSQDGAASKERERQMRQEIGRLQTDLDKERIKAKSNAEKVSVPFWVGESTRVVLHVLCSHG